MFFDTHIHVAPWSHDASQSMDDMIADAEKKNLLGVCITDHYEKDLFYEPGYEDIFDPDALFKEIGRYRRFDPLLKERPSVLIGAELGWLPHLDRHLDTFVKSYNFDSIILSLHLLDNVDPFLNKSIYDEGLASVYKRAIERMSDMIEALPNFDILGHFDYISRYSGIRECKMIYEHAPEAFDKLFTGMIKNNKALEINSGTVLRLQKLGYAGVQSFPDQKIIERYLEMGGNLITLGSDSHIAGNTAVMFDHIARWLKSLGVDQLVFFAERKIYKYDLTL